MNSREISKLAMMYSEIDEALKDIRTRKNAAITLQATWRGILARRNAKTMLKGFMELQKLYRERLQVDERRIFLRFNQNSSTVFN